MKLAVEAQVAEITDETSIRASW